MKTIERLKQLLAKATPEPWKPHYRDTMWRPDLDQDGLIEAGPGDWGGFKITEHRTINRLTAKHCEPADDIALIAAARNALPALLAVVEAAENYMVEEDPTKWRDLRVKMGESLAALHKLEGGE